MNNSSPREVLAAPNEINIITVYSFFCSPLTASQSSKSRTQRPWCARGLANKRIIQLAGTKEICLACFVCGVVWITARRITHNHTHNLFLFHILFMCYYIRLVLVLHDAFILLIQRIYIYRRYIIYMVQAKDTDFVSWISCDATKLVVVATVKTHEKA